MSQISNVNLLALIDSVAAQVIEGLKEFDNTGALATSFTLGALNNRNRVVALGDAEQEGDLINQSIASFNSSKAYPLLYTASQSLIQALNVHLNKFQVTGINGALTASGDRAAPEFNDAHLASTGIYLSPSNVFPPETADMGVFTTSGVGAGAFVDGDAIDTDLYAGADLEIKNTGPGALAGATSYDVTCVLFDGTTEIKTVAANALAQLATVAIGIPGTNRYVDVTTITVTGGQATDEITVISVLDRAVAL